MKGVRFAGHRVVGDIVDLACHYRDSGADELVFYDITASPDDRTVDVAWVRRVSRELDIPFTVAGGIRSVASAEAILNAGAEKVSVNSPALANPELIDQLAARFGRQCVVVGIDSDRTAGGFRVRALTGRPEASVDAGRSTLDWAREAQERGAGEIVLNVMTADGVRGGFDIPQLVQLRRMLTVPLVASGGAGTMQHFLDVFQEANVDGALAAGVFHDRLFTPHDVKRFLLTHGVSVRP